MRCILATDIEGMPKCQTFFLLIFLRRIAAYTLQHLDRVAPVSTDKKIGTQKRICSNFQYRKKQNQDL